MSIDRLSGGLTPKDGADPRTFPTIWNETADEIERIDGEVVAVEGRVTTAEGDISSLDGRVTANEGDIGQLQSDVSTNTSDITGLQQDTQALDGRVGDVEDVLREGFVYAGTRYFFSDGTFDPADPLDGPGDIGLRAIRVRVQGAGGGGGGVGATGAEETSVSAGGGGGGYGESFITDIAGLSSSVSVTVGLGGVAGDAGDNNGGDGGDSVFDGLTATGGGGGQGDSGGTGLARRPGGSGGTATGFDVNISGSGDGASFRVGNLRVGLSGHGASSFLAAASDHRFGRFANEGKKFGGGGSGVANDRNEAAFAGAAGADGIVIVDCFV